MDAERSRSLRIATVRRAALIVAIVTTMGSIALFMLVDLGASPRNPLALIGLPGLLIAMYAGGMIFGYAHGGGPDWFMLAAAAVTNFVVYFLLAVAVDRWWKERRRRLHAR